MLTITDYQHRVLSQNEHASLLLGGAKAGSKSHALCLLAIQHCEQYNDKAHCLIVRLTYQGCDEMRVMLLGILKDKYELDPRPYYSGATNTFTLKGGGRIELGYLQCEDDLLRYRGRGYSWIGADEVADVPPKFINMLRGEIRAHPDVITRFCATANPARPHHDYWRRYVRAPWTPYLEADTDAPFIYCPAFLEDNPFIDAKQARRNLMKDPNAEALITGNWDAVNATAFYAGAWDEKDCIIDDWNHVPEYGMKFALYIDHGGGSSPTACLWTLTCLEPMQTPAGYMPKGSIIVLDDYDDSLGRDSGDWMSTLGLSIADNCAEIVRIGRERWNTHSVGRIDPQVEADHGDERRLIDLYHANDVSVTGWRKHTRANASSILREMLHEAKANPDDREKAGIYFCKRAEGCIATIPYLPRDKNNQNIPATKGVSDHHHDCAKAVAFERAQEWTRQPLFRGLMAA